MKTRSTKRRILLLAMMVLALGAAAVMKVAAQFRPYQGNRDTGVVTLDKNGWASVPFERGYLDNHFCVVGDSWDDVDIGFSAKGFTVSEGHPDQEVAWGCVVEK